MARYTDVDALLSRLPDDLPYKASVKRVLIQAPTADVAPKSEVEKLEHEIETLKDNNEHLAVMLEETKIELEAMRGAANSYKMHYENLARKIFMDIDRVVEKYSMGDIEYPAFLNIIAEFKKKYTEG